MAALLGLSLVGRSAEVGSGGAALREEARENGLNEGAEDNLGATVWSIS